MNPNTGSATTILIVDDEPLLLESCARILNAEGYEVQTATTAGEGLGQFERTGHDIVIVDLKLPDIDGLTLMRQIKARRPQTVVIMITGFATVDSASEAVRAGAFEYVPKPFTATQLRILSGRAAQHVHSIRADQPPDVEPVGLTTARLCECGCGEKPVAGIFRPGHDQRLRKELEERVGGLLAMRGLVAAAEAYAHGHAGLHTFSDEVRRLFAAHG